MTQERRKDNQPREKLDWSDTGTTLIDAALHHLDTERAASCLLHVPDTDPQLYVAAGTKDALRGLLRDDPVGDTEVLAGQTWNAPAAPSLAKVDQTDDELPISASTYGSLAACKAEQARRDASAAAAPQGESDLVAALQKIRHMTYSAPQTAQWISEAFHVADDALSGRAAAAPLLTDEQSQIVDTDSARRFVDAWHLKHFPTDRTFSRYIIGSPTRDYFLAGDFAWQLAKALEAMEARATLGASPSPLSRDAEHDFKNFHRLLCERFDYTHDERDWKRDQLSLIEHIALKTQPTAAPAQQDQAVQDQAVQDQAATDAFLKHWDSVCHDYGFAATFNTAFKAAAAAWSAATLIAAQGGNTSKASADSDQQEARDAARYRWLRGSATDIANVIDKEFAPGMWEYRCGEELDAAIDSAMSAAPLNEVPAPTCNEEKGGAA